MLYGDYGGRIDLNVGWLDAEFDEFFGLDDPLTPILDDLDLSGGDMVNAPDWNIGATWVPVELEMLNGMLRPMVQFSFKSDYITRPHDQSVDKQDSYTRTNASLHWESNKTGLFLEGFVHNIEDEDIQTTSECQQRGQRRSGNRSAGFELQRDVSTPPYLRRAGWIQVLDSSCLFAAQNQCRIGIDFGAWPLYRRNS